jgi:hypothetical protein
MKFFWKVVNVVEVGEVVEVIVVLKRAKPVNIV